MVPTPAGDTPAVEFNRDIRPLLSDHCFQCHGPDTARRKAGLRLDTPDGAVADLGDGRHAVVPGKPEQSELLRRLTAADDRERMPPASKGPRLTPEQIARVRRWIEQGAKWQSHWAFLPPARPDPPPVRDAAWVRNPIDRFVRARLERDGVSPAPEADPVTLLRRVSFDLTGLPPTPAEVDALLADPSPAAYEKAVDRLLASPRYGERMAMRWLDAARYADTNGYQSDGERYMWRWRDWVIDAYNANLPFDQFTIEQLAGDLLPNPTLEQKIATGFNRNHRGNAEGGIIPEEYAVEYVVDRVDTTATVWLGLTLGCCRCHSHKFDPVSQKEFYQLFAFFNNVPERGKAVKFGNSPPMIKAPTQWQRQQLAELEKELRGAERRFDKLRPAVAAAQAAWEATPAARAPVDWSVTEGLIAHTHLDGAVAEPGTFRDGEPAYADGRIGRSAAFDGRRYLDLGDVGNFGFYDAFSLAAWVYPDDERGGTIVARATDTARAEGYSLVLAGGKLQLNLVKRWLDDALRMETVEALPAGRWSHVVATYDGSRVAAGVRLYVNGVPQRLKVNLDDLNQSFQSKEPLRIGSDGGAERRFHGRLDDVKVFDVCLKPEQAAVLAVPETVPEIVATPAAERSPNQVLKLSTYYLEQVAAERFRRAWRRVGELRKRHERFVAGLPTTMVMEELPAPRDTFVLRRGEYDKPGEKVSPGVPACLPPLPADAPRNRLGLARWLVAADHPLTARVAVNRLWQQCFGTGLVKTQEDFGSQGEWPSHPELLDWLATEYVRLGWDTKAMLRLIVTSATYRQASRVTPELAQKDPENRLLARGPRFRLAAEMIRDQALAAGGLLVERLGGPSVKPYQPEGLWNELSDQSYQQDHGVNLYRRGLYTFWKRTVAPPTLLTFDAAGRETCVVRQARTNTPLQALALMNDVTFVEAARVLGQRVLQEGGPTADARLTLAFRLVTARSPRPEELRVLRAGLNAHLDGYRRDPDAARKLVSAGEAPRDERLDVAELAAYTAAAGLLLNLDEAVTRE